MRIAICLVRIISIINGIVFKKETLDNLKLAAFKICNILASVFVRFLLLYCCLHSRFSIHTLSAAQHFVSVTWLHMYIV